MISKYLSNDGIWTPVIPSSDRCACRHCLFLSVLYHFCLHSLCDLCRICSEPSVAHCCTGKWPKCRPAPVYHLFEPTPHYLLIYTVCFFHWHHCSLFPTKFLLLQFLSGRMYCSLCLELLSPPSPPHILNIKFLEAIWYRVCLLKQINLQVSVDYHNLNFVSWAVKSRTCTVFLMGRRLLSCGFTIFSKWFDVCSSVWNTKGKEHGKVTGGCF